MREITLVQGHPYSNDDGEEGLHAPSWFYWGVIIAIGVGVGVWLKSGGPPKR